MPKCDVLNLTAFFSSVKMSTRYNGNIVTKLYISLIKSPQFEDIGIEISFKEY